MIDIHCHILPGIDDGAENIDISLQMAKQAVEQGFSDIIATPHHLKGDYSNPGEIVRKKVAELNQAITEAGIPLTIHPGQEVRIHGEMLSGLEEGSVLSLADSKYVLIEFPTSNIPLFTGELFFNLQTNGYVPIIAHPERNMEVLGSLGSLYDLVDGGALAQLTFGSYQGRFGKKIKRLSETLLKANLVHFLATDAHYTESRSLVVKDPLHELYRKEGRKQTAKLLGNSKLVLQDEMIIPPETEFVREKRFFLF
ncbi:tyrosine-protein phosphatase [Listeria sp. PSOL-1]|uniref:tyrosine-protein phosphatase n=1 Tax=Listeria sp. PSOL-1 TaxID=1844999 RepID=UPI0013D62524|nr:CpsB/CapC family capsule biosynthesis tyrosine phosphatase [Listeria sp. PSOL-1]